MNLEIKNHLDMYWIEDMFVFVFRYSLGRVKFCPSICMDFLEPLIPYLSVHTLSLISTEIGEYNFSDIQYPNEWRAFKKKLDEEIIRRYP